VKVSALALAALLFGVTQAHSAESWIGRWAEETKFCTRPGESGNETPMVFSRTTARWFGTCNIRSIKKQSDVWVLKAKCPSARPLLEIRLSIQGERLKAFWGEAHPQVMVRCP
jgi:hypothetical protein